MGNWKTITGIILIAAGLLFAYGCAQAKDSEWYQKEYAFKLTQVHKIKVEGIDARIHVIPTDSDEIKVEISGTISKNQNPYEAELSGTQLTIKKKQDWLQVFRNNINPFNSDTTINITLNANYGKALAISSVSGAVNVSSIQFETLDIDTVSSAINLSDIMCGTAKLESVSGGLSVQGLSADKSTVSTISGTAKLIDYQGDLTGSSVSGRFEASYAAFNHSVRLNSVSGAIVLRLTNAESFQLDTQTISGRITNEFENKRLGSGKNTIHLETVSGSITVQR